LQVLLYSAYLKRIFIGCRPSHGGFPARVSSAIGVSVSLETWWWEAMSHGGRAIRKAEPCLADDWQVRELRVHVQHAVFSSLLITRLQVTPAGGS